MKRSVSRTRNLIIKYQRLLLKSHLFLNRGRFTLQGTRAVVSFTFDDFPCSAFRTAGSILKDYGARGTYYVALGLMNTKGEQGPHFTVQDLYDLIADGHELACHTFSHLDRRSVSLPTYEEDVSRNQMKISNLLPGFSFQNFAYPFGGVTLATMKAMRQRFVSCRGTFGGINVGRIDRHLLRANRLYSNKTKFGDVERLIHENAKVKGWLIFYTHDVSESPSQYGCDPRYFEAVVRSAIQSQAKILPVDQTLTREVCARSPASSPHCC